MVWTNCKIALGLFFASTVLVLGQAGQAGADGPGGTAGSITVLENGRSVNCRIVTSWATSNGSRAFQVQNPGTGEFLTLVQDNRSGTSVPPGSVPMQIYHWGSSRVSPNGAPVPTSLPPFNEQVRAQFANSKENVIWWEVPSQPKPEVKSSPTPSNYVPFPVKDSKSAQSSPTPSNYVPFPVQDSKSVQSSPTPSNYVPFPVQDSKFVQSSPTPSNYVPFPAQDPKGVILPSKFVSSEPSLSKDKTPQAVYTPAPSYLVRPNVQPFAAGGSPVPVLVPRACVCSTDPKATLTVNPPGRQTMAAVGFDAKEFGVSGARPFTNEEFYIVKIPARTTMPPKSQIVTGPSIPPSIPRLEPSKSQFVTGPNIPPSIPRLEPSKSPFVTGPNIPPSTPRLAAVEPRFFNEDNDIPRAISRPVPSAPPDRPVLNWFQNLAKGPAPREPAAPAPTPISEPARSPFSPSDSMQAASGTTGLTPREIYPSPRTTTPDPRLALNNTAPSQLKIEPDRSLILPRNNPPSIASTRTSDPFGSEEKDPSSRFYIAQAQSRPVPSAPSEPIRLAQNSPQGPLSPAQRLGWDPLPSTPQPRDNSKGTDFATNRPSVYTPNAIQQAGVYQPNTSTSYPRAPEIPDNPAARAAAAAKAELEGPAPRPSYKDPVPLGPNSPLATAQSRPFPIAPTSTAQASSTNALPSSQPFSTSPMLEGPPASKISAGMSPPPTPDRYTQTVSAVGPPSGPRPEAFPVAPPGSLPPVAGKSDFHNQWGNSSNTLISSSTLPGPRAEYRSDDILKNPEKFNPPDRLYLPTPPTVSAPKNSNVLQPYAGASGPTPNSPLAGQGQAGSPLYPPGTASIRAASNSAVPIYSVPVYMPVPVRTTPDLTRMPSPPAPQIPEPPQPNNYVNAFTQPGPANIPPVIPASAGMDAYTRAQLVNPALLAQIYAANPFLVNPFLLQQGIQNFGLLAPQQQAQVQQALYVQHQTVMQQSQAMVMQQQAMIGRPIPPYNFAPANYQVPQTPNPMPMPAVPNANVAPVQYMQPQIPQNQASFGGRNELQQGQIQQLLNVLTDSTFPALRETAANSLATCNVRNPLIVQSLLQAAKQDPAVSVRVACLYSLSRMNVANEPNVLSTVRGLLNDPDPRVRHEAQEGLQRMGVNQ